MWWSEGGHKLAGGLMEMCGNNLVFGKHYLLTGMHPVREELPRCLSGELHLLLGLIPLPTLSCHRGSQKGKVNVY